MIFTGMRVISRYKRDLRCTKWMMVVMSRPISTPQDLQLRECVQCGAGNVWRISPMSHMDVRNKHESPSLDINFARKLSLAEGVDYSV
jgi:hypothetical protein